MDSTQRNGYRDSVDSTQRNGIQRKGTGGQHSEEWDKEEGSGIESTQRNDIERKGTGWTALR